MAARILEGESGHESRLEGSWGKVAKLGRTKLRTGHMVKRAMPISGIPDDFQLTEKTIAWVNEKYPTVNIEGTLERFTESAQAHGRMYADWQAAFKTWVRKAIENKWDGVEFKQGKVQDPKWISILKEVEPYGFRKPHALETPQAYRTSFESWQRTQKRASAPVLEFGPALKKMGHS
jgi:hypothetical protein